MKRKIICCFDGKDFEFVANGYPECCGIYGSLLKQALNKKLERFEVINMEE